MLHCIAVHGERSETCGRPGASFQSCTASLQTGGRGVDLALNSLADDKLTATVRCIAPHGHLLEIGKYDILKQTGLSMRPMHYNISFQGVDLDNLFLSPKLDAVRPSLGSTLNGYVAAR